MGKYILHSKLISSELSEYNLCRQPIGKCVTHLLHAVWLGSRADVDVLLGFSDSVHWKS